jgi:3-deoxy-D-manno-octulosonate 8-phosphate phosphatase (KDO 8-P phosphatase)
VKGAESSASIARRAAEIRLLVLDVDGVLTDGRLYFSRLGEEMKSFHVRDGAGIVQLLQSGVQVGILSGRNSGAVDHRAKELGISLVRQGVDDKLAALNEMLGRLQLNAQSTACIGDDRADVPIMQIAGLSIAVADAHDCAKECAHFTTKAAGGMGAVREACDLILAARETN